jgi:DNA helicase-2/ATP-dependent DNA helicase PcrA
MGESADPVRALAEFRPPPAAAAHWADFAATIGLVRGNAAGWPAELDLACRWYAPHLERRYDDAAGRHADLLQLAQIASTYANRQRFLTELTLDPPDASSAQAGAPLIDEDYLILSTIHSAKGQEWTSVFVLNVVDGCIPSDLAAGSTPEIEEERRLLYVAMTRARDHLHLMVPQRFFTHNQRGGGDRHVYAQRTRFIPEATLKHFASRAWPAATSPGRAGSRSQLHPVDVRAKMRRMWG